MLLELDGAGIGIPPVRPGQDGTFEEYIRQRLAGDRVQRDRPVAPEMLLKAEIRPGHPGLGDSPRTGVVQPGEGKSPRKQAGAAPQECAALPVGIQAETEPGRKRRAYLRQISTTQFDRSVSAHAETQHETRRRRPFVLGVSRQVQHGTEQRILRAESETVSAGEEGKVVRQGPVIPPSGGQHAPRQQFVGNTFPQTGIHPGHETERIPELRIHVLHARHQGMRVADVPVHAGMGVRRMLFLPVQDSPAIFAAGEDEKPVLNHGSPCGEAENPVAHIRSGCAQAGSRHMHIGRTGDTVRARFRHDIHGAAGKTGLTHIEGSGGEPDGLDLIQGHGSRTLQEEGIARRRPVDPDCIVQGVGSQDRKPIGAGRDLRRKNQDLVQAARKDRHRFEHPPIKQETSASRSGRHGSLSRDDDLSELHHWLEHDLHLAGLAQGQGHILICDGHLPQQEDIHLIGTARTQPVQHETALFVGNGHIARPGRPMYGRDRNARERSLIRVGDEAPQGGAGDLRERGCAREHESQDRKEQVIPFMHNWTSNKSTYILTKKKEPH